MAWCGMAVPRLAARGMEETLAAHAAALKQAEAQREEETGALQEQLRAAEVRPVAWGRDGLGMGRAAAARLRFVFLARRSPPGGRGLLFGFG